jgi:IS30 family transposase
MKKEIQKAFQIPASLKVNKIEEKEGKTIIHYETIYRLIYKERPDLKKYLRCRKGKYKRRYGTKKREKEREESKKRRIDTRPEIVDTRERIGDWEGDTMRGSDRKAAILTHVDRKSGYLAANKLIRALAAITREATIGVFSKIPKKKRHTITYDNGSEFAEHETTERDTKIIIYFANAYHSWERGTNENTNGLLRQFFPKKTNLSKITDFELQRAVNLINTRPRKRLHYHTPKEVFLEKIAI